MSPSEVPRQGFEDGTLHVVSLGLACASCHATVPDERRNEANGGSGVVADHHLGVKACTGRSVDKATGTAHIQYNADSFGFSRPRYTAIHASVKTWYHSVSLSVQIVAGSLTELQRLASGETFVNKLLGTDCFTKSLGIVNKDCSKLDSEKKSRLAMALAICHLEQLGLPAFTCKPSMSLKQCADSIKDDRQYTTYMEFLSNVDT